MNAQDIFESIRPELREVEATLQREGTASRVPVLSRVGDHILSAGGKRIRPALTLLCGRQCETAVERVVPLAASVELIHNATLLHDDIVDAGAVRRGKPAAHLLWGDPAGVLTANLHFSRAYRLVLDHGGVSCLRALNETIRSIVEGELLQFLRVGTLHLLEEEYREIISRKTACLIATACQLGALPGPGRERAEPLYRFGFELGMAFQIMDDLLDYTADEGVLGKRVGTDFREAKFTLPLIVTLARCPETERVRLQALLEAEAEERAGRFAWARDLMDGCGAFARTLDAARTHKARAVRAICALPSSQERDALAGLAEFVVSRSH